MLNPAQQPMRRAIVCLLYRVLQFCTPLDSQLPLTPPAHPCYAPSITHLHNQIATLDRPLPRVPFTPYPVAFPPQMPPHAGHTTPVTTQTGARPATQCIEMHQFATLSAKARHGMTPNDPHFAKFPALPRRQPILATREPLTTESVCHLSRGRSHARAFGLPLSRE